MPTQAVFYRDAHGREPVREYLRSRLTHRERRSVEGQMREMNGIPDGIPPLPFPQTSQIEGGLRELRCHAGKQLFRILYRRSGNLFVLLHAVRKEGRAISARDIELAERRWRDFKRRMDSSDRRGPRAAGRDAP